MSLFDNSLGTTIFVVERVKLYTSVTPYELLYAVTESHNSRRRSLNFHFMKIEAEF